MKINNLTDTLSEIKLSHTDLQEQIKKYSLSFPQVRNKEVEWGMRLPMFVPSFYKYVKQQNVIPTQENYYKFYADDNSNFFTANRLNEEQMIGLKARLFRTYPSLVRDLHFGLYLKTDSSFDDVFYNEILDIEYGIDLVVDYNSNRIGLCLYTQTKNALHAREVKTYRPKKQVDFTCFEMPIDFRGSISCGQFFLYGTREKESIITELNKLI